MVPRPRRPLRPPRIVDEARRIADFDVLCLQEIADHFPELAAARREPVRRTRSSLPGYRVRRRGGRPSGCARPAQRFGNLICRATRSGRSAPHAALAGRPQQTCRAFLCARGHGAVRAAARDDHAPRVLLYTGATHGPGPCACASCTSEACGHAAAPPLDEFRRFAHPSRPRCTRLHAILLGDFNLGPTELPSTGAHPATLCHRPRQAPARRLAPPAMARRRTRPPSACSTAPTAPRGLRLRLREGRPAPRLRRVVFEPRRGVGRPAGAGRARRSLNPQRGTIAPKARCTALLQ